ncbi:protein GVQW3-like [Penaeus vannamei]|uniref:protein GVQW3-like n=1 Tax=Penaeus vannamei TaxID=6689 RepID=UPI00387F6DC7
MAPAVRREVSPIGLHLKTIISFKFHHIREKEAKFREIPRPAILQFKVRAHRRQLKVRHHSSNMESTKIETRTNIKFMISRFRSGKNNVEDELRSGRQPLVCEENTDAVRDLIEKDRRTTTESVADTLIISVGSANTILVESLGLSKLSARRVPRLLHPDQQQTRADLSIGILRTLKLYCEEL